MNKLELITKVKALAGITQDERAYLINLVNTKKKYGLVWEDKPEDVEELLRNNLPVLKEVKEKAIVNGEEHPNHILIEGDNLHALTALTFTHENKIDVIYIDPPYNTGSKEDFIYNDHYVDKEDAFRHSKWLSFMSKRLNIAKKLMSPDGVIFCSIGDDEISQLTLLFNEIFTEENKLGAITRVAKTSGDMGSYFAPSKDYVLAYSKNKSILSDFKDGVDETLFKKTEIDGDKKGEKYRDDVAFYQASQKDLRPNQKYFVICPNGDKVIPPCSIQDEIMREGDGRWRWSKETYLLKKHLLVFKQTKKSPLLDEKGNRAKWNVYTKSYLNERSEKGSSPRDFLDQFINRKGADLIKQYDIDFSFSKPFELIEHLIKITNKNNQITILDFFSGSGTALHATLSLNNADNGKRTCIIATNNENKICEEVTYPRCHRVINKYTNKKGNEMPYFPKNNLRYFKSEFVSREPILKNKRELTKLATELLCIKENIYSEVKALGNYQLNSTYVRCFGKDDSYLIIIYDDETIDQIVKVIKDTVKQKETKHAKFKVYVFSNGQYPYTEEFEDVLKYITLCALPDAIYKAYQNVLPKKNRQVVPELEEDIEQTSNTLFN